MIYNSVVDLTSGGTRKRTSSVFPGITTVVAAYSDGTVTCLVSGKASQLSFLRLRDNSVNQ